MPAGQVRGLPCGISFVGTASVIAKALGATVGSIEPFRETLVTDRDIPAEWWGVFHSHELDALVAEMRQALLDHLVIFLRDQTVTPLQQLAFARKFGEPIEYPQLKGLPESPFITPVVKLEHERNNFGGIWHSDTTYLDEPPMGSMLHAQEVPPFGGDTPHGPT